jgi:ADP-L-glycero-D-manno-heptose 6-epimerase
VYVEDVVAATLLAGEQGEPGIYNAGSGTARSFNEVVAILKAQLGSSLPAQYIDNPHADSYQNYTQADLTLSREALGFEPLWSLEQGIADYLRWLAAGSPTAGWTSYDLGPGTVDRPGRAVLTEELA